MRLWFTEPVDMPNATVLDAEGKTLYLVETFGLAIARVSIMVNSEAVGFERMVHMPRCFPDGIAYNEAKTDLDRLLQA